MPRQHFIEQDRSEAGDGGKHLLTADEAWAKFVSHLKDSEVRVTPARRFLFIRVCELPGHFSADELAIELAHGPMRVSRATVFRTIDLMRNAGLVGEVRDAEGHARYEHSFDRPPHEHMICDRCGRFIEFGDPGVEARIEEICTSNGFNKRRHRLVVFGICDECGR